MLWTYIFWPGRRDFPKWLELEDRTIDIFDGYIADSKNNEKPLVITIDLEAFSGFMDWSAVNDLAVRYMVQKAATENIVFTLAANVVDYHKKYHGFSI